MPLSPFLSRLRDRASARGHRLLQPLLRPLDPVYDWDRLRTTVTRERLASALSIWRYEELLPSLRRRSRASHRGSRRSSRRRASRRRSASGLWLKLDTPTRRTRSTTASSPPPARKAQEFGLTTPPAPPATSPAPLPPCGRRGPRGRGVRPRRPEPEKLARRRPTDRRSTPWTASLRPLLAALGRAVVRAAVGFVNVNLRSLRRGLEDARVRAGGAAGRSAPDVVAIPIASGAPLPQGRRGSASLRSSGSRRPAARQIGGQAEAASRSRGVPRGKPVTPVRAGLDRPLARDRDPGGRRLRGGDRPRDRARRARRPRGRGGREHGPSREHHRRLRRDRCRRDARGAPGGGRGGRGRPRRPRRPARHRRRPEDARAGFVHIPARTDRSGCGRRRYSRRRAPRPGCRA